jgi:hypothetical protein
MSRAQERSTAIRAEGVPTFSNPWGLLAITSTPGTGPKTLRRYYVTGFPSHPHFGGSGCCWLGYKCRKELLRQLCRRLFVWVSTSWAGTTDPATGGAAGPGTDKGARRGNIDYGEHIDYRDGHTSWPIRISTRPMIGRHSYSVDIWRDRFASLSWM